MNHNYQVKNGLCGVSLPSVNLLTRVGAGHIRKKIARLIQKYEGKTLNKVLNQNAVLLF